MADLQSLRRKLLTVAYESGEPCHLASSLSVLEIIWTLYDKVMGPDDIFILSKGHAALALYVVLNAKGIISDELLATFGKPDSKLYGHPHIGTPGIYCTTGSLGHGCAVSVGAAYAKRLKGESGRIFCLLGDGECEEGSAWEAATLASRFGLTSLTWVLDANASAPNCEDVIPRETKWGFVAKFEAFGWDWWDAGIKEQQAPNFGSPSVWINCVSKGHGILAMEADPQAWHRRRLTEPEYREFMSL